MAQYKHLPVYRTCRQLLLEMTIAIKQYPRDFRYTIGQRALDEIVSLIALIVRANSTTRRRDILRDALERLAVVEVFVQLAHDVRALSSKKLMLIGPLVDSIGRQVGGWLKGSNQGESEPFAAAAQTGELVRLEAGRA